LVDVDELRRRIEEEFAQNAPKGWTRDEVLAELAKHPDNVCEHLDYYTGKWTPSVAVTGWGNPDVPRTNVRVVRSTPDPEWVPLTKLVGRTIQAPRCAPRGVRQPHLPQQGDQHPMIPPPLTDDQHAKLPRWASTHIKAVEGALASAIDGLEGGPDESNVFAFNYATATRRSLGKPGYVEFELGDGSSLHARIAGGRLMITAPDGGISVRPWVSNVVMIGTDPR